MNSKQVIEKLKAHFPKDKGFVFLEQVANSTGFASRFADAIAMNVWKSRFEIIGLEVKVSRSDWRNEIKQPAKADKIFQYCDSWFIATPEGVIRDGELPKGWGWLEVKNDKVFVRTPPVRNVHKALDDFFVASVIRRCLEQATPEADLKNAEAVGYRLGQESVRESCGYEAKQIREEFDRYKKCIRDYEAASGLNFQQGWSGGQRIGEAVRMVLSGEHLQVKNRLTSLRAFIDEALQKLEIPVTTPDAKPQTPNPAPA